MYSSRKWASRRAVPQAGLLLAVFLAACDQTEPRGPGAIRISATAVTLEQISFQYSVAIDSGTPWTQYSGVPLLVLQTGLAHGGHRVTVGGVPANCTGKDPRDVTLKGDDTVLVALAIACPRTTGDLSIQVTTSGSDTDPNGYMVLLDGLPRAFLPSSGSAQIRFLSAGSHTVSLTDVASNCTAPASQSVNLTAGGLVTVNLNVTCEPVAALRFVASIAGPDGDPDGYTVAIDGQAATPLSATQTTVVKVAPGARAWTVADVQTNCTVGGPTSGTATMAAGDTVTVTLAATCSAIPTGDVGVAVTDPANDTITTNFTGSTKPHDVLGVTARYATGWMILVVRFAKPVISSSGLDPQALYGFIELNVDESVTGGVPASNAYGASAANGVDYVISFSSDTVSARLYSTTASLGNARVRTKYEGDSVIVQVPLQKIGGDDGNMAIVMTLGTKDRPTDIAPNTGSILARVPAGSVSASSARSTRPEPTVVATPVAVPLPVMWRAPGPVRKSARP